MESSFSVDGLEGIGCANQKDSFSIGILKDLSHDMNSCFAFSFLVNITCSEPAASSTPWLTILRISFATILLGTSSMAFVHGNEVAGHKGIEALWVVEDGGNSFVNAGE